MLGKGKKVNDEIVFWDTLCNREGGSVLVSDLRHKMQLLIGPWTNTLDHIVYFVPLEQN